MTAASWTGEAFPPVDHCIYAHRDEEHTPFTDEHIIPFGLLPKGGDWFLPKSNCLKCNAITTRFEDTCLRGTFGVFREHLDLKTRRKKNRNKPREVWFKGPDGSDSKQEMQVADIPRYCLGFNWLPPGILRGQSPTSELNFSGETVLRYARGELEKFIPDKHGFRLGSVRMLDFARMLAKIAHSYAIGKCGENAFEPMLPDLILGRDEHAPYLIGGDPRGTPPAQPRVLHDIYPMSAAIGDDGITYLGFVIRLFAFWETPTYFVIVGRKKWRVGPRNERLARSGPSA
ncbi:hypothetical protein [Bradyrhizobium sp. STM 3561]|uniref:hypothetical protein n=1 Tax=Bradyrhizobium sp. STM 3561 TaxID=578923 RepID=UPI00388EF91D